MDNHFPATYVTKKSFYHLKTENFEVFHPVGRPSGKFRDGRPADGRPPSDRSLIIMQNTTVMTLTSGDVFILAKNAPLNIDVKKIPKTDYFSPFSFF